MSVLECKNKTNIRIYSNFQYIYLFGHSFESKILCEYIRTLVCVKFLIEISSDIRLF